MTAASSAQATAVRNYALVTAAYWGFTITDGAIRMLVLLHFHKLGFTPIQIAMLFLFYEIFGVITNFLGGWIGSLFGLRLTLYGGIAIQIFGLVMLGVINLQWPVWGQVTYVMTAQALAGIAKDLTKMSSKSAIRLVVPREAESRLFRWVAMLTGSKKRPQGGGVLCGSGPAADLHRDLRRSHGLPHGQLRAGGGAGVDLLFGGAAASRHGQG
jgi:MFS family permease